MKHIIEIQDYNNPSELKKVISKLQCRRRNILRDLGYDQIHFNGSKYNTNTVLPIIQEYYSSTNSMLSGQHYVYFHCNPLKQLNVKNNLKHLFLALQFPNLKYEPFYIGKGIGNRAYNLTRNDSHRKIRSNLIKYKKDIEVIIIENNLTEETALLKESYLIDILGIISLSSKGLLVNLDEGLSIESRKDRIQKLTNPNIMTKIITSNGFRI